jgi:polyisoprenoid-binding protein YceI
MADTAEEIAQDTAGLKASSREVGGRAVPASGVYTIDTPHTMVEFVARQLMVSRVRGRFSRFGGTVTITDDPLGSHTEVGIEASSVSTGDDKRDAHLRSPDFLDAESFPTLAYTSTGIEAAAGDHWRITGDLTIHGQTHPVVLDLEFLGAFADPWAGQRIAFLATGEINREEWGLTYNQVLESGGVLVSKKIRLELAVTAIYQGPEAQERAA